MSVPELFKEAYVGLKSLVIGLGVTGRAFLKPGVTVIYPKQEVDNLASFRGHVELIGKEESPDVPRCVACGACVKGCPSQCISVLCPVPAKEGEEPKMGPAPQKGCKTPGGFVLDFSLCSLCGQCVKVCPVDSLRFSNHSYFVGFSRQDFQLDLLTRLRRQASEPAAEEGSALKK